MGDNNRNFIIAATLSVLVLILWQYFYVLPRMEQEQALQQQREQQAAQTSLSQPKPSEGVATPTPQASGAGASTSSASVSPRVAIDTPRLRGSIALRGGYFDDLYLKDYFETPAPGSPQIRLLAPLSSLKPYYAAFGWTPRDSTIATPNAETLWQAPDNATLAIDSPLRITWDNGAGLVFERTITIDENFMFTVTQSVTNNGDSSVELFPYGLVTRHGAPEVSGFFILHEGLIGIFDEEGLQEIDYDDLENGTATEYRSDNGWIGITDKYWGTVLVPSQGGGFDARFFREDRPGIDVYQSDYLLGGVTVEPGGRMSVENRLFAGAKQVALLDDYEQAFSIPQFDLLIDWGWFYFLTKPLFLFLDYFYNLVGNFGISILLVTVCIKLAFFPLANKSYIAMSRMKKLQPEMVKLRERFPDDRMRQQQELMTLYKREKVNPMQGCLPVLVQIPVFFALYKVLFVTIEMRHAPFYGWIQDLSAPDPTSIFNLFGLLPFEVPSFLLIGIWPLIMGVTMWAQMRMNPAPTDPIQQKIFAWMPVLFTVLLAGFPAGLVIYWAWNNFLSILQQGVIMRRQGVPIALFDNIPFLSKNKSDKTHE
ncbi:MAG: membrane protein insertase YidC [Hyphomicrobiales bacterium]|nr:membrane protein insertase YidC [Hyphomicrobiales bacterium]MCY4033402.1 membrane protein insertase YidC [Hyphomicrobiales bacterium]